MPSPKIDWTQPIELDDGTPLVAEDTGAEHTVNIRTEFLKHHAAFPIDRFKGYAQRESGLVGSNHGFRVRNRKGVGVRTIDLSFQVNDLVQERGAYARIQYRVTAVRGDRLDLANAIGSGGRENVEAKMFKFACHKGGAPFESISYEPGQTLRDGYQSGLAIGLIGDHYSAGGPGGVKLANHAGACRHLFEHDKIDKERHAYWMLGWKAGQARAKDKQRFDKSAGAKFRVLTRNGGYLPAKMVRIEPDAGGHRRYVFEIEGGGTVTTDSYGSAGRGNYDYVVENIPMSKINIGDLVKPRDGSGAAALLGKNKKFWVVGLSTTGTQASLKPHDKPHDNSETLVSLDDLWLVDIDAKDTNTRKGYLVVGGTDTTVWETLEDASVAFHGGGGTDTGRFILLVTQVRDSTGAQWRTVGTDGPINALPHKKVRYQPVKNQDNGTGTGYVLGSVYENMSQAAASAGVDGGVLKVSIEGGKVVGVELLP